MFSLFSFIPACVWSQLLSDWRLVTSSSLEAAPCCVHGQLGPVGLEKEPSCLVLTSLSCSSCLWPRRYRYSMCITSVFLMRAFSRNSSRIRGMKPGLSRPARRKCRYRARTCFWSLLWRDIGQRQRHRREEESDQDATLKHAAVPSASTRCFTACQLALLILLQSLSSWRQEEIWLAEKSSDVSRRIWSLKQTDFRWCDRRWGGAGTSWGGWMTLDSWREHMW